MPKMKSHGGSKKRFKITGSGKVVRGQACRDHLHSHKTASVKRQLRSDKVVSTADSKTVKKLVPYK